MKRLLFFLAFLIVCFSSFGQSIVPRSNSSITVQDSRFSAQFNLFVPRYADTTAANIQKGIDSAGAIIYTYDINNFWVRKGNPKRWTNITQSANVSWGDIVGNMSIQTDLIDSLNKKLNISDTAAMLSHYLTTVDTTNIPEFWKKVRSLLNAGYGIAYSNGTISADSSVLSGYFLRVKDSTVYYPYQSNPLGYITTNDLPIHGNGWLSSPIVVWLHDYTYWVGDGSYAIGGKIYNFDGDSVSLAASDPSLDRIDIIVLDTLENVGSIQGTPNVTPEKPVPDVASQIEVTLVYVKAASTQPDSLPTSTIIRDEGNVGEWTIGKTMTSTDNYSTNPYHGLISQRITAASGNQYMQWTASTMQSKVAYNTLILYIRNNVTLSNFRNLLIRLYNGGTQVGNSVNITSWGYSKSLTGSYQLIGIPMSAFGGTDAFDRVRLTNTGGGGTVDVQVDYVQLQSGVVQVQNGSSNGITTLIGNTGSISVSTPNASVNIVGSNGITTNASGNTVTIDGIAKVNVADSITKYVTPTQLNGENLQQVTSRDSVTSHSIIVGRTSTIDGITIGRKGATDTLTTVLGRSAFNSISGYGSSHGFGTAIGFRALYNANSQSYSNMGIGKEALYSLTRGYGNIGIGELALGSIDTSYGNLALGNYALNAGIGNGNIGIGWNAGGGVMGSNNILMGYNALAIRGMSRNGNNNVVIGGYTDAGGVSGDGNTIIGNDAWVDSTLHGSSNNVLITSQDQANYLLISKSTAYLSGNLIVPYQLKLPGYTGAYTGTPSYSLGINGSGDVIKYSPSPLDTSNKWVNSISRVPGKDSIIFYIGSTRYAIKDSVGSGGGGGGTWGSITGTLSAQTDLQSALDAKEPTITASNTIKKYWNGYKQWVSLNSDSLTEGSTNLFYTNARARAALSASAPLSYNSGTGAFSIPQANGSTDGYLSSTDWNTFNSKFTLPSLTAGSVLFSNGTTIAQDNSNLFWDNTNKRLGIKVNNPVYTLQVRGDAYLDSSQLTVNMSNYDKGITVNQWGGGSGYFKINSASSGGMLPAFNAKSTYAGTGIMFIASGNNTYSDGAIIFSGRNAAGTGNITGGTIVDFRNYTTSYLNIDYTGRVGIGVTSPTGFLHIKAGTATAGTAPLKLTAGTNLTTTEAGAIEYDGSHLYFTATNGGTRYQLDQQGGGISAIGTINSQTKSANGAVISGSNLVMQTADATYPGLMSSAHYSFLDSIKAHNSYIRNSLATGDSLLNKKNDSTLIARRLSLTAGDNMTIATTGSNDSLLKYTIDVKNDTTALFTFGAGSGASGDTTAFSTSALYGSFYNAGSDSLIITSINAVMQGSNDTLKISVCFSDTLKAVSPSYVLNSYSINNNSVGKNATSGDFTTAKIPPGKQVYCLSPYVLAGRKPTYLSVTVIGYKKRKL